MTSSLRDLFQSLGPETYIVEQPKIKTMDCDVLALSCCAYRKQSEQTPFVSFQSINPEELIDEDQRNADDIRKYYGKKYLWTSLQSKPLTDYQQTVLNFITNENRRQYIENQEGLIHKLPEFYFNDLITDAIFKNADTSDLDTEKVPPFLRKKYTKPLRPVNVVKSRTKRSKENKYWLKDENNRLCLLSISLPNSLEHMWIDLFNSHAIININGHFLPQRSMSGDYYKIVDWTLEK